MASIALPRSIRIGGGSLDELADALEAFGLGRPALIADPFLAQSGALDRVTASLAGRGVPSRVFTGVVPDPTTGAVGAAAAFIAEGGHDCVIGFGGGSAIDTAKAAAVLSRTGGAMRALKVPHAEDRPALPIVAIPTTAGTGSEATRVTVITDDETGEKMLCAGLAFLPTIAIVDYELTLSCPRRLSADTGIDALTHAIEAYVSRRANPFSDAMALSAMRLIAPNLRRACDEGDHRPAREAMMLGALQAGIAFSNASVALVHGMSRPIGARFHVAHGLSNAMLLPAVTAWSVPEATARYAACARAMDLVADDLPDEHAAAALVEMIRANNAHLDVPSPRLHGIDAAAWEDAIPLMVEQALASGSPANNPRVPDAAAIGALYRAMF